MSKVTDRIDEMDYTELDYTYGLLSGLTEEELLAVQTVVIAFLNKKSESTPCLKKEPFRPQTEKQLLNRIDHSIAQIGKGAYTDSEEFEKEMLAGISVI